MANPPDIPDRTVPSASSYDASVPGLEHLHLDVPSHIGLFFMLLVVGLFLVSLVELPQAPDSGGLALPTFLVAPVLGIAGANTLTRTVRRRCRRVGEVRPALRTRYDLANSLLGSLSVLLVVHGVFALAGGLCTRLWGLDHPLRWATGMAAPAAVAACAAYATWRARRRTWLVGPAATTLWLSALLLGINVADRNLGLDPSKPLIAVLATVVGTGAALVCRYGWRVRPPQTTA